MRCTCCLLLYFPNHYPGSAVIPHLSCLHPRWPLRYCSQYLGTSGWYIQAEEMLRRQPVFGISRLTMNEVMHYCIEKTCTYPSLSTDLPNGWLPCFVFFSLNYETESTITTSSWSLYHNKDVKNCAPRILYTANMYIWNSINSDNRNAICAMSLPNLHLACYSWKVNLKAFWKASRILRKVG